MLAWITKSPRDYAPVPCDPRPLRRRNEILGLMARNGYISTSATERQWKRLRRVFESRVGDVAKEDFGQVGEEASNGPLGGCH